MIPKFWKLELYNPIDNNYKWKSEKLPHHGCEIYPMKWTGGYYDEKMKDKYNYKANTWSRQTSTKYFVTLQQAKKYCFSWMKKINKDSDIN